MSSANQEGYPKCLSLRTSVIFCSLPFSLAQIRMNTDHLRYRKLEPTDHMQEHCLTVLTAAEIDDEQRSEESRVGKECAVRVELGGRGIIKKKKRKIKSKHK